LKTYSHIDKMNKTENTYYNYNTIAAMPLPMDSLNYHYNKGTNRLNWVHDAVPYGNYPNDINNETTNNYKYNGIGELASDDSAKIDTIIWTVYGKVKKIVKYSPLDTTPTDSIVFEYDPLGNRLEKRNYIHQLPLCHACLATPITDTVKYIRDATGNILTAYDRLKKLDPTYKNAEEKRVETTFERHLISVFTPYGDVYRLNHGGTGFTAGKVTDLGNPQKFGQSQNGGQGSQGSTGGNGQNGNNSGNSGWSHTYSPPSENADEWPGVGGAASNGNNSGNDNGSGGTNGTTGNRSNSGGGNQ